MNNALHELSSKHSTTYPSSSIIFTFCPGIVIIIAIVMWNTDVTSITKGYTVPPILRLPFHVRQRIYLHVGLIPTGGYGDHCVLDLHGQNQSLYLPFHGLLISCRTIYAETSEILYSTNRFNIRYWDKRSLEPLRNLTPRSLSNLTYLKIILNETSCHGRYESEAFDGYHATRDHEEIATKGKSHDFLSGHNEPLRDVQPLAKELLMDWALTVNYLSSAIGSGKLELCVVCDVDPEDIDTAKLVVEPLSRLPQLKDCHLRLSRISTPELNSLTRHTALQLRGLRWPQEMPAPRPSHEPSQPTRCETYTGSRLLNLPVELRFRILEYTDLITPWKEVTWSRRHQAFVGVKAFCAPLDHRGEDCPPHVHHGCQFIDCWQTFPEPCIGCFCRVEHSAFSSTCMCWTPPQYLFLVCRTLYEDSLAVFYSGNRFVIHDYNHQDPYNAPLGLYSSQRMAASIFFADVVPERCLKELRFVELVFPPYSHEGWPNEAALNDWSHTMSLASKRLSLPGLTIRLIMEGLDGWRVPDDRADMTEDQGNRIISSYERIVAPIAFLGSGGLAKFYSFFTWPWAYTRESEALSMENGWDWVMAKSMVLQERFGRLVMGDRYESLGFPGVCARFYDPLQPDSGEPTNSIWVRKYIRDA